MRPLSGHLRAITGPVAGLLLIAVVLFATARGGGAAGTAGQIAFSKGEDIWIARADGTRAHRAVGGRGPQDDPSWAPDGRRFVYRDSRFGYNVRDEIYLASTDGSPPRNLTRSLVNEWGPAWAPDGRLIAFNADGRLYVMRPDGRGKRRVTGIQAEYPAWSPDGRFIVFTGSSVAVFEEALWVVRPDGSDQRPLGVEGTLADWSAR